MRRPECVRQGKRPSPPSLPRPLMLSDLQRRKYTANFNLYDTDGNGTVERSDFERVVDRWTRSHGLPPDSPDYARAQGTVLGIWEFVRTMGTPGGDGVALSDWMAAAERIVGAKDDPVMMEQAYRAPARSLFAVMDRDGDGRVSEAEYCAYLGAYGVEGDEAREAFGRLDRDGDGSITVDEWVENVVEFYFSDDPTAPGNWYIGPF